MTTPQDATLDALLDDFANALDGGRSQLPSNARAKIKAHFAASAHNTATMVRLSRALGHPLHVEASHGETLDDALIRMACERLEVACAASAQTAAGAGADRNAYEGAREALLEWKGRAQRAEATLRSLGYTGIDASHPPASAADGAGELPPLPEPGHQADDGAVMGRDGFGWEVHACTGSAYTEEQMHAYARAAIAALRQQSPANRTAMPEGLTGDARLAFDQCRAVAHMARAIVELHDMRMSVIASGRGPIAVIGESSAMILESLGDVLNGMDAVVEEDAWIDPIIRAAQERWPVALAAYDPAKAVGWQPIETAIPEGDMHRALDWVHDAARNEQERAWADALEEAVAAYDPARVGADTVCRADPPEVDEAMARAARLRFEADEADGVVDWYAVVQAALTAALKPVAGGA